MLRTERLVLRPLIGADAEWITDNITHPEVHRWLTSLPHPYTRADGEDFIARFGGRQTSLAILDGYVPQGVITIESAKAFAEDRPEDWELGYWLRREAHGRGLMTEAARAMVDWHRATHGATLHSGWIAGNAASGRVLSKLGFLPEAEPVTRHSHYYGRDVQVVRVRLPMAPRAQAPGA
jgi:RimJ/RimL family protein N-acetyltransferase